MQRIISALANDADTGVNLLAGADDGRRATASDFVQHCEGNLDVVLLVAPQRAADGVEQKTLRLVDGVL